MPVTAHVDVLIVGAGLAGIGVAYHLQQQCPQKSYRILEARGAMGGTWDLFRYPGIRSDSSMHLYGYSFRPWPHDSSIGSGEEILKYLQDTATEAGIDHQIQYNTKVLKASWSSKTATWTVETVNPQTQEKSQYTCGWLQLCSGYFSYDRGHSPDFPGQNDFEGDIIHPQKWPKAQDTHEKRFVVIGSGATAITLIPSLAQTAKHVTMVQRSPSYVHLAPEEDRIAKVLRRVLPEDTAYQLTREKNMFLERLVYKTAREKPEKLKKFLLKRVKKALPESFDVQTHFTPRYQPWDQRLCLSPDGDLFEAIRSGKASVVTGEIERFTPTGLRMTSGEEVPADVIVTATGLKLLMRGGISIELDGVLAKPNEGWIYKGVMISNAPNLMLTAGTLIASYTLRVELTAHYLCRILKHMDRLGAKIARPELPMPPEQMPSQPFVSGFSSGYIMRAIEDFPKQGLSEPWLNVQEYRENKRILEGPVDDGVLKFQPLNSSGERSAQPVAAQSTTIRST